MKLETFMVEAEETIIIEQIILMMAETAKSINLSEGLQADCAMSDGKSAVMDTINKASLASVLDNVANGKSQVWDRVVNKSACMKTMMATLNSSGAPCDVTVDNPGVKKVVTDKIQNLWLKIQTAGAQNAKAGVKAAFDAMKVVFATEYKSILNAPAVAKA